MKRIVKKCVTILMMLVVLMNSVESHAATLSRNSAEFKANSYISDDLNYFAKNEKVKCEIISLANQIRKMKVKGDSEYKINNCLSKNYLTCQVGKLSLEDCITKELNDKEKKLYKKNKAKAILCMANGVFASQYAKLNYEKSEWIGGNGDAFRHTIWCYGMVIDVGHSFAKKWSDAHEDGDYVQPQIVRKMDLHNNKIGLKLGKDYPGTVGHSTFISRTKKKVSGGKCRRIVDNKLVRTNKQGMK